MAECSDDLVGDGWMTTDFGGALVAAILEALSFAMAPMCSDETSASPDVSDFMQMHEDLRLVHLCEMVVFHFISF